jgi:hypothetical protein
MRMLRRIGGLVVIACLVGVFAPPRAAADIPFASVEVLRPIFSRLLGDPSRLRLDAVPDVYEGGYARVSVYAQDAEIKGMRIDEMWIRLIGVSFDPAQLRQGTLKVLEVRDSGLYGKLRLTNIQTFLGRQGTVQDVNLRRAGDAVIATGTVVYNGAPTRVRMQGVFQVYGEPEIYFHIQTLWVNSLPVPYVLVDQLERSMNPIVDFRTWPVPFKIRSFRTTPEGYVLSSQTDYSQPCNDCGGPEIRLTP